MSSPQDSRARGNLANNPSLPFLLGCCCLGLILCTIAGVIVMALIPTYLPSKADGLSRVNATSMESWLHARAATTTSGRKRLSGTLDDYVGCEFGASGREQVRQAFRSCLTNPLAKDVTINSVLVAYTNGISKKKRFALDREARQSDFLTYVINFALTFDSQCIYGCQTNIGGDVQKCLQNMAPGSLVFNSVPLLRDGILVYVASQLRTLYITYVSSILSSMSPFRPGRGPSYRLSTVSSTTAMSG